MAALGDRSGTGPAARFPAAPDNEDVHALVVRQDGTILARGRGDPDDVSWEAVASVLLAG